MKKRIALSHDLEFDMEISTQGVTTPVVLIDLCCDGYIDRTAILTPDEAILMAETLLKAARKAL